MQRRIKERSSENMGSAQKKGIWRVKVGNISEEQKGGKTTERDSDTAETVHQ